MLQREAVKKRDTKQVLIGVDYMYNMCVFTGQAWEINLVDTRSEFYYILR